MTHSVAALLSSSRLWSGLRWMSVRARAPSVLALGLGAGCVTGPPPLPQVTGAGSSGSSTSGAPTTDLLETSGDDAVSSTSAAQGSTSTTTDSSASSTSSGSSADGRSDSSGGTTGEPSPTGCADGFRDALLDEMQYPDIAACAGGFWVSGVHDQVPMCDRQAGNDGPVPDGMGCSIEDLCGFGWHVCVSRDEVVAGGLGDCDAELWNTQFFATGQSGEGANTCADTGTNDVYGCGDIGSTDIFDCEPLNRGTGNLCAELSGPWACDADAFDEASFIVKTGPSHGGALCCRDGL